MQLITKSWPDNTVDNKKRWASMTNRPPQFRTLAGCIEEVEKFFKNNQGLQLPKIAEEISRLVDLLLCSGYRSTKEEGEFAEEFIKIIKSTQEGYLICGIYDEKDKIQYCVVDNFLRKYAPYWAEALKNISPTFDLAYLISFAANAFHFRVGNCGEHAALTQALLLLGGKDYFGQNGIYSAFVIITKNSGNHAQVLLVRGERFAEIIKMYLLKKKFNKKKYAWNDLEIDSWKNLIEINYKILKHYNEAKKEKNLEKEKEAAEFYSEWLRRIDDNIIEDLYRELRLEKEENAYVADGFWGKGEHPKERIENPETKHFKAHPLYHWGCVPDLKVLFCRVLYGYKEFLLSL